MAHGRFVDATKMDELVATLQHLSRLGTAQLHLRAANESAPRTPALWVPDHNSWFPPQHCSNNFLPLLLLLQVLLLLRLQLRLLLLLPLLLLLLLLLPLRLLLLCCCYCCNSSSNNNNNNNNTNNKEGGTSAAAKGASFIVGGCFVTSLKTSSFVWFS